LPFAADLLYSACEHGKHEDGFGAWWGGDDCCFFEECVGLSEWRQEVTWGMKEMNGTGWGGIRVNGV
ncbi:hypothetical protein, partial [Paenibacillus xylanexedens]|uniref:hypothetical protein n=1 Tax=Paenibacillus xylanexedens TaxID=528191 RepID=UPI001C9306BE